MNIKWIAIIERSRARLYKANPFSLIESFENKLGREKNRAMTTDKAGVSRAKLSQRSSTHILDGEKNPHDDAAIQFSRKLASHLEKKFRSINNGDLVIASEPRMTGYLRQSMSDSFCQRVQWSKRNLGHCSDTEVMELFNARRPTVSRAPGNESDLPIPLHVVFRDFPTSNSVYNAVWDCTRKLLDFYDRIIRCEVTISAPHRRQRKGRVYHIQIRLSVPGPDVVVMRESERDKRHEDIYIAIRDAFRAAARKLEDRVRKMRGQVKQRTAPLHGKVVRIFKHDGYGFIQAEDGREFYFHENSLVSKEFQDLTVGTEVRFAEEIGDKGPQVSSLSITGKNNHRIKGLQVNQLTS